MLFRLAQDGASSRVTHQGMCRGARGASKRGLLSILLMDTGAFSRTSPLWSFRLGSVQAPNGPGISVLKTPATTTSRWMYCVSHRPARGDMWLPHGMVPI